MSSHHKVEPKTVHQDGVQLSFFQLDDPVLCQIRDEILNLDVNNLTPLEALNKLNDIKKIVRGNNTLYLHIMIPCAAGKQYSDNTGNAYLSHLNLKSKPGSLPVSFSLQFPFLYLEYNKQQ